jgi:NCS1 family nucleobase:cation symporter-1
MTITTEAKPKTRGQDPASDRAGRIETHGTDHIEKSERHGRPRSLVGVWAASNLTYLYLVLGGTMILLGLNLWQSIAVIVGGNLAWIVVGYLSISGPASGTPSEVITRAMYGIRGNRFVNLVIGWVVGVAYEAINLSVGALAGFALVDQFAGRASFAAKVAIVIVTAIITFTISVYGHATIVRLSGWFTWILLAAVIVLAVFVFLHADFGYQTPAKYAVHGAALWAVAAIGFSIIASAPLSWGTGADYSRYLPVTASRRAVMWWTTLGGFAPAVVLGIIGALAGTVVDMSDPQSSLKTLLPSWFYPVFLVIIILGSITNNVLTAYSTGLALLAVGIPWKRSVTVIFDAIVSVGITGYALFISNFFDSLNSILELTVALLGPALTIYAVDIALRKNRYDGLQLMDESRTSRFWYRGGFNLAGIAALVIGTAAASLFLDTTLFVGPLSNALDGADLSVFVGPIVAGVIYATATVVGRRAAVMPNPEIAHPTSSVEESRVSA